MWRTVLRGVSIRKVKNQWNRRCTYALMKDEGRTLGTWGLWEEQEGTEEQAHILNARDCGVRVDTIKVTSYKTPQVRQVLEGPALTCQYWILCLQSCWGWRSWIHMHCLFVLYSCNSQKPKPPLGAAWGRCSWTPPRSQSGSLQSKTHQVQWLQPRLSLMPVLNPHRQCVSLVCPWCVTEHFENMQTRSTVNS